MSTHYKIAIIGLGYVGLPLAVEFSKFFNVIGFDIKNERIKELKNGFDNTKEIENSNLVNNNNLIFTNNEEDISKAVFFIVTVPTPIDKVNKPNFEALKKACKSIAKYLKKEDIVIFESTVYPGATREICIPILERDSGLKLNRDFGVGYSPERINPGDKKKTISDIIKVTSGSDSHTSEIVDNLYQKIIKAGTHRAQSIEIAEAAKVIENTQRDINIALMNELSKIFNKLGISNEDILKAANTKWNFLDFKPGLVGGHCIGVDPYYLTERALQVGYKPELILAGRRINDEMPKYVVDQFVKLSLKNNILKDSMKVLVLGITFKENCPDIRNSKSIEVVKLLIDYGFEVDIYDPIAVNSIYTEKIYNKLNKLENKNYCGIIIPVAHEIFKNIEMKYLKSICIKNALIFDLKGVFPRNEVSWSL